MTIGMQVLVTALTVAVTVTVTAVVNYFISAPSKFKRQREKEHQEFLQKIDGVEERITESMQKQKQTTENLKDDIALLKQGNQAIIKNELKLRYEKWLKLGYAPVDAKDDLERMYDVYHRLGSNGVLTEMRNRFLALPNERVATARRAKRKEG